MDNEAAISSLEHTIIDLMGMIGAQSKQIQALTDRLAALEEEVESIAGDYEPCQHSDDC